MLLSCPAGQLDDWAARPSADALLDEECALDEGLQRRAWTFLATRIRLLVAAYPTKQEVSTAAHCARAVGSPTCWAAGWAAPG